MKHAIHDYMCMFNTTYSFHNKLKTTYLNGKMNRRVDFLLDVLLQIEKDQYFKYMYRQQMLGVNHKAILETQRHERGMKIPKMDVKVHDR